MAYLDSAGLTYLWNKVKAALNRKQDVLTGEQGQVVGFGADGKATAVEAAGNLDIDSVPTAGSANAVSSGGVYSVLGDVSAVLESVVGEV